MAVLGVRSVCAAAWLTGVARVPLLVGQPYACVACAKADTNRRALNPHDSYDTCPIAYAASRDFWDELWDERPRNSALIVIMMQEGN